jgi:large repetitive protein
MMRASPQPAGRRSARSHRWRSVLAAVAGALVLGGVSAAVSLPASAATPSCGPSCLDLYNGLAGSQYILDSLGDGFATGTPIILDPAQNINQGEDFNLNIEGTANDFYQENLVGPAIGLNYPSDLAGEIQYEPFGVQTGECVGVPGTPATGTLVALETCGVSADTVWVLDPQGPAGSPTSYALISSAGTAYPDPYTLTFPSTGPSSAQLDTTPLQTDSSGAVGPAQDWFEEFGTVSGGGAVGTATSVASSPDPSVAGQVVTYTATVSPAPDGGTAAFTDGGTTITGCGTQPVGIGTGTATCQVTYASPGTHSIAAVYTGDSEFGGSTTAVPLTQTVGGQPPSITSSPTATFLVGTAGSFTVQATGVPGGPAISITEAGTLPAGVTFTDNGNGTATLAGTPAKGTRAGSYPVVITASNGVPPAAVQDFTLVVKSATTVRVLLLPGTAQAGVPVLVTAVLSPGDSRGTVSFTESFDGGPAVPIRGCQNLPLLLNVTACLFTPPAAAGPGTYTVTASYSGDSSYASAAGSAALQALAKTSLTLKSSSSPRTGSALTVTATVSPVPDGGSVSFQVTGPNGRNVTLPASCTAAPAGTGTVPCIFTPAAKGRYAVTAAYSGDSLYLKSAASLEVQVS